MKTFLFYAFLSLFCFIFLQFQRSSFFSLFSFPEFNRLTRKTDRLSESG